MKNKKSLRKLTRASLHINFFFHLLLCIMLFMIFNMILMPFAYLKTVVAKFKLSNAGRISLVDAFAYIVIGIPLLLVLQVTDLFDFITWTLDTKEYGLPREGPISKQRFLAFY